MDPVIRHWIPLAEMPKFIWVVEYSEPEEYDRGEIGWSIILDATAMNYQHGIFIAVQNREHLLINQRDNNHLNPIVKFKLETASGIRYTNNLEEK